MNFDETRLLDCGDVASPAGLCQYDGCGATVCPDCDIRCDTCHRILCPEHLSQPEAGAEYCPDHVTDHVVKKLAETVADRYL